VCSCPSGYELDEDEKTCLDVNECLAADDDDGAPAACPRDHSYCFNTAGSFVCECDLGYKYDAELDDCIG
jgi:fibulin 1/2